MAFLEISYDKTVQVVEEKQLYSQWGFRPTELGPLCLEYGLLINRDVFIIERTKRAKRLYPIPVLLFETTSFRRVVEGEKPCLLRKFCQTYKKQRTHDRLGRLVNEYHTPEYFGKRLGLNPQYLTSGTEEKNLSTEITNSSGQ